MRVQYEEVVAAYEQGLQTQLRGFRPAHAFLETWVHDADPARSILSMVEAAELGGVEDLEIALGPGLAARVDRARLVGTAAEIGKAALKEEDDGGIVLQVSGLGRGKRADRTAPGTAKVPKVAAPPSAGPGGASPVDPARYYDWAMERFPTETPSGFETPWPQEEMKAGSREVVQAILLQTFVLNALIDRETHRILRMHHNALEAWPRRPQDWAILNGLCSVSTGYTIQDVSEHAVIRLENLLRGSRQRPVPGVVQPENSIEQTLKSSPALQSLLDLTRQLLKDYQAKTKYPIQPNFEEGPVLQASSEWGTSTVPERIQRVQAALPEVCLETGIRGADVTVMAIAGPRVTVALPASAPTETQRRYLTLVEPVLRARVDRKIEVFLDNKRDANAKRHATEEALGI